jgi:hypothetical protein
MCDRGTTHRNLAKPAPPSQANRPGLDHPATSVGPACAIAPAIRDCFQKTESDLTARAQQLGASKITEGHNTTGAAATGYAAHAGAEQAEVSLS